ncbi:MAG: hypothetical protein ACRD1Z_03915, partial [Vicinamibacteria bacterium]
MNAERWPALIALLESDDSKEAAARWAHTPYALGLAYAQSGDSAKAVDHLFRARPIYRDAAKTGLHCDGLYRRDFFGPVQARFEPAPAAENETACSAVLHYIDSILARSLVDLVLAERKWKDRMEVTLEFFGELLEENPRSGHASTMVHDVLAFREAVPSSDIDSLHRIERFIDGAQAIAARYAESPLPYYLCAVRAQEYAWQGRYEEALREAVQRGKDLQGESARRAVRFAILMARGLVLYQPSEAPTEKRLRELLSPLLSRVGDPGARAKLE